MRIQIVELVQQLVQMEHTLMANSVFMSVRMIYLWMVLLKHVSHL